jgi:hypothetical protein
MVQQQLIMCLGWKGHQFCLGLAPCLPNFSQQQSKTQHGVTQLGTAGAGCTLKHHKLDHLEDMQ